MLGEQEALPHGNPDLEYDPWCPCHHAPPVSLAGRGRGVTLLSLSCTLLLAQLASPSAQLPLPCAYGFMCAVFVYCLLSRLLACRYRYWDIASAKDAMLQVGVQSSPLPSIATCPAPFLYVRNSSDTFTSLLAPSLSLQPLPNISYLPGRVGRGRRGRGGPVSTPVRRVRARPPP